MAVFSMLGLLALVLVTFIIGLRLLLLARRTRQLPELVMGLALLLLGAIGSPVFFAAQALAGDLGAALPWVVASGIFCVSTGGVSLWLFTWRTFRPTSPWAAVLVALGVATALAGFAGHGLTAGFEAVRPADAGFWYWVGLASRSLAFAWAAVEAARCYRRLRRQQRIGLAEPLIVNRMLLWAIASASAFVIFAMIALVLAPGGAREIGVLSILHSLLGLVGAVSIWLAFFPPSFYRRRFETPVHLGPAIS